MEKIFVNWSGGKDAALALYRLRQNPETSPVLLLTTLSAEHNRVSMHGLRHSLLQAQAAAIGLPLQTIHLPEPAGMEAYERLLTEKLLQLKTHRFTTAVFGDIFLEDLRQYREQQLRKIGIKPVFPLWQEDTRQLLQEFIQLGFKAIVICINAACLDKTFCGRTIDQQFINDLPAGVDPCGENGEYHSFVYDGPIFESTVNFTVGELVYRQYKAPASDPAITGDSAHYGYWFCDLY